MLPQSVIPLRGIKGRLHLDRAQDGAGSGDVMAGTQMGCWGDDCALSARMGDPLSQDRLPFSLPFIPASCG